MAWPQFPSIERTDGLTAFAPPFAVDSSPRQRERRLFLETVHTILFAHRSLLFCCSCVRGATEQSLVLRSSSCLCGEAALVIGPLCDGRQRTPSERYSFSTRRLVSSVFLNLSFLGRMLFHPRPGTRLTTPLLGSKEDDRELFVVVAVGSVPYNNAASQMEKNTGRGKKIASSNEWLAAWLSRRSGNVHPHRHDDHHRHVLLVWERESGWVVTCKADVSSGQFIIRGLARFAVLARWVELWRSNSAGPWIFFLLFLLIKDFANCCQQICGCNCLCILRFF